jgi:hypothetical protein
MLILDFLPSIPYNTRKHAHWHTCRGIDIIHPYGSAALPKVFLRNFATLRHFPNPERSRKKNEKKKQTKQNKQTNKQNKRKERKNSTLKSEKKKRTPRLQWLSDAPGRQQGG